MREKCLVKDNCELLNQPLQIPYKQFEVCVFKLLIAMIYDCSILVFQWFALLSKLIIYNLINKGIVNIYECILTK